MEHLCEDFGQEVFAAVRLLQEVWIYRTEEEFDTTIEHLLYDCLFLGDDNSVLPY